MKPPKFHVGQAVVLMDNKNWYGYRAWLSIGATYPQLARIYHVREVLYSEKYGYGLRLAEIINPIAKTDQGCAELNFLASRFAPVELLPDEVLAELLAETLEPVTA